MGHMQISLQILPYIVKYPQVSAIEQQIRAFLGLHFHLACICLSALLTMSIGVCRALSIS